MASKSHKHRPHTIRGYSEDVRPDIMDGIISMEEVCDPTGARAHDLTITVCRRNITKSSKFS